MPSMKEMTYLARDFWRVSTGRDYFHRHQGLGAYFRDPRCYYIDFTAKAQWEGEFVENVPAIYVPAWGKHVTQAVMVVQYGLGCMDRYFLEGDPAALEGVRQVSSWIPRHLRQEGFLDNRFQELNPRDTFYSNNSALTEGEALSFCVRAIQNKLVPAPAIEELRASVETIARNMMLPLDKMGTVLRRADGVYLCEYCRKDEHVVLNGWIIAAFGLRDYVQFCGDAAASSMLEATLQTLVTALPDYQLPNGWTYYDNKGLICSPFYHAAHISLLDALDKLQGDPRIKTVLERCRRANGPLNRVRYTLQRAVCKLCEKTLFAGKA